MAVNCCVSPLAIDGLPGVTAIDTSVALVTISVSAGLVMAPDVAVMFEIPLVSVVARPDELIVATLRADEFQVTEAVRFCVLLFV